MFDFVHKNKRIVQAILGVVMLPFAFWGVYSYNRASDAGGEVATIGRDKVTRQEFDEAVREQQNRMRRALGPNFDAAAFDNPEVRYNILEGLVSEHLLRRQAQQSNVRVSDAQLQKVIADIPAFQDNGKFSQSRYESLVANQNMSTLQFEQRLKQDLQVQPIQQAYVAGAIVAKTSAQRYVQLGEQQREVIVASVDVAPYLAQARVDDAAVKAFYDANPSLFQTPEQVKMDYIVLSRDSLAAEQQVSEDEIKKVYGTSYAPAFAEKEKARKKAEGVLAEVKKHPEKFAELAKQYSQDPGSAKNGGDLGFFARGSMVKPFEDAVFSMKPNQVSDLVESDFGFHIIKLTAIKPADKAKGQTEERQASHILIPAPKEAKDYAAVEPQIEQQLKQQKAATKFAEAAENFQNLVYEQADNLQSVGKTLNLKLEHTDWMTRAQAQQLARGSAKFAQAVFAPDAIQTKRNTEAVEIAPNTLMAARVTEHKVAAPRPFAEVKAQIETQLKQRAASEMALKAGKEKLALLNEGKDADLKWGKPQSISRQQHGPEIGEEAVRLIFGVSVSKLPAYVGTPSTTGGFSVYKITKVDTSPAPDEAKLKSASARLGEQLARESLNAYMAQLKQKADVKIKQENLEKK